MVSEYDGAGSGAFVGVVELIAVGAGFVSTVEGVIVSGIDGIESG